MKPAAIIALIALALSAVIAAVLCLIWLLKIAYSKNITFLPVKCSACIRGSF